MTNNTKGKSKRRLDKDRLTLRTGESQRKNGTYSYRWTTRNGERKDIYARTLEELRQKEDAIRQDIHDGIKTDARNTTLNEAFELWCDLKRGLKDNTFQNYKYMYNMFVRPDIGKLKISQIQKSDVKRFYNKLADDRILQISTIDSVHTVLHQVFDLAVDDNYLRHNPSDGVLKGLKQSHNFQVEKRKALTVAEQKLFLDFLKTHSQYNHWYPVFAVMLGTGMRVGEVVGLRWCDIDLDEGMISVNHTLVYYNHGGSGCYFGINTPKTKAGARTIPIMQSVKDAFLLEKQYQEEVGITSQSNIDCYTGFIFVNRFGNVQHQGTLNKAIRRIIRDCNDEVLDKGEKNPVLLPPFSCHSLRHTFTTRLCESGVNIKVIQDILGHADVSTTLGIYADVTKDLKKREIGNYEETLNQLLG